MRAGGEEEKWDQRGRSLIVGPKRRERRVGLEMEENGVRGDWRGRKD